LADPSNISSNIFGGTGCHPTPLDTMTVGQNTRHSTCWHQPDGSARTHNRSVAGSIPLGAHAPDYDTRAFDAGPAGGREPSPVGHLRRAGVNEERAHHSMSQRNARLITRGEPGGSRLEEVFEMSHDLVIHRPRDGGFATPRVPSVGAGRSTSRHPCPPSAQRRCSECSHSERIS